MTEKEWVEKRSATAIGSTVGIPEGTLVTVPTAASTGSAPAPVVAVVTTHWYSDPAFLTMAGGATLALYPVIDQAIRTQTFNWKDFALSCVSALGAYFRNRNNTVVK